MTLLYAENKTILKKTQDASVQLAIDCLVNSFPHY